jgi:hypothetical protein
MDMFNGVVLSVRLFDGVVLSVRFSSSTTLELVASSVTLLVVFVMLEPSISVRCLCLESDLANWVEVRINIIRKIE